MKRLLRSFTLALAAVLLWSLPQPAAASHFRFANLSWKRAPGTNSLAVEITVTEAWRISSGGIGEIFYQFGDGSPGFSTATATRVATLSDVVGEQYEVWRHTTTHTYPSNDVFTVSGSSCCRISTLVNAADASESLTMLVDLRNPANTGSPVTTAPVILQMQAGTNNSVALPIVDPDGDAFSVRFATSAESSISSLPTVGANTISVTAGGVLNWNTIGGASGQKFALQVIIEENRAGNTTGTNGRVPLDFIIELAGSLTNLTPTVTGTNGSITLAPNQTFTTTFVGTDPEGGPLRVNHQGLPPGATITPADGTTNASPASVMFSWTPAPADVGSSYAVLIFFTDQGGLQRAASFALTVSASAVVRDFELLSINAAGTASGSGASLNPVVSSNGQYVAFVSDAANLVANDNNGARDVFWRDRVSGTTRLVSRTPAGASGNNESDAPVISADGRYVAFHSRASDLVAGDTNAGYDVFLWDAQDNSVTLVSRTATGASGAGDSFVPRLSANGRVVAFLSLAGNLVPNDTNETTDAFAYNLDTAVMSLASVNTNGQSGNGFTGVPALSADGRHVAFVSRATDLVTNDTSTTEDVFVRDLQLGVTRLVSVNVAGTGGGSRLSFDPVISADGRFIAFASGATNLVAVPDLNNFPDIFVRDTQLGMTKLASINRLGTAAGSDGGNPAVRPLSFKPVLSADGTKVLFESAAADLVPGDNNNGRDVFLRDLVGDTTTLVSVNRFGTGAGTGLSAITPYSLSADLRYIAFLSDAADLGAADTNGKTDVFLRDLATNSTKIISRVNLGGFSGSGHSFQPVLSADGSTVFFTSEAENLDSRDANAVSDVFAASTALGTPNFGVVDVGVSISTVTARTVGSSFTLTVTVTNHSAAPATGLVLGNSGPSLLQFLSGTASQGTIGTNSWLVGDLVANGSATAVVTLVATNLGEGDVIVSIIRRDQLDSNLNNNAALSTITVNQTAAGALFYLPGNTAYLSRTNSPFFADILSGAVTLEAFERGNFSLAGVTASAGTNFAASASTDSVDADDGLVDGSGNGGQSFLVTGTNAVTFSFNAAILGRLPTRVGIVLTDGDDEGAGIEVFGTNGVLLGVLGPFAIGDNVFTGETAEDRFLGAEFAGGISAVRVFYASPGFELDHLQFDIPTTDLAMSGTGPGTAAFGSNFVLTLTVTNRGPVTATGVVVTNADPGDVNFLGVTTSQGTVDTMTGSWSVGTLAAGASATFTATLTPGGSGLLLFRAGVSSALPDAHTANDSVSLGVTVPNLAPNIRFASNTLVLPEDLPALSFPAFAQVHPQETNQLITNVTVTVDNPALFAVPPGFQTNGTLELTLAGNAVGTAVVTVTATDNGGTLAGGVDRATNTFTITVSDINDAPVITFTTNLLVALEDSGANTLAAFATFATVESGQAITNVTTTNSNPALFSVQPFFTVGGTLMFTPFPEATGTGVVTVIVQDDGGTASGGVDRATNTFAIAVLPVNTAPTFTLTNFPAADGVLDWERDASTNAALGVKVAVDASGNVIVAGDEYLGQDYNIVVAKYSPAGTLLWTNTFSGSPGGTDQVKGLALDSAGNVLITGASIASTYDYVTLKYSAAGVAVWTNYFDNGGDDTPEAITVDSAGNVLVTGHSKNGLYGDYLTIKYMADGTPVWTNRTSYAGPGNDTAKSVAVDASGDVYVTGDGSNTDYTYAFTLKFAGATGTPVWTNQFDINGENSYGVALAVDGSGDVLVAANYLEVVVKFAVVKYTAAGVPVWTNRYDRASGQDQHLRAMAVDGSGSAIVTGETYNGTDFDYTILKVLSSGVAAWTNHYDGVGGGVADYPLAITVSSSADVFVTGHSTRTNGKDFLTVKYSAAGAGVWTNRYDSASHGDDQANALAVDASGNVFVTGTVGDPVATSVLRTIKYAFTPADGANQTVTNTVGAVTVTGFIASSSVGTTNESAQTLSFIVTNDNNALFSVQPAISPAGVLTYTVAPGVSGLAVVTVRAQDNGGTANGGADLSAPQSFNITVLMSAGGTVFTWLGGTGPWNTPANWSPNGVPGVADTVTIGSGNAQVTNAVTVSTLTLSGGFISGAGSLSIRSAMTWSGGTLIGAGTTTIANGAVLTVNGGADKDLRRRLDNYGTVTWTAGRILGHDAATIYNFAGALFDTQSEATLFESGDGTVKTLHNFGTVRKSAGTGTSAWSGTFNNSGTVNVQTGTLNPVGAVTLSTSAYSGAGKFMLTGCTLAGTLAIESRADVDFASGTMLGTGTIVGTLNWTGGMMGSGGTTTIATNGVLLISGATDKDLRRTLDNYGTVTWTDARILGHSSPIINNQAGAVFEARANTTLYESGDGTIKTFNNSGTVRRTVGTGNTVWSGLFNNSATLIVETGMLSLSGGGTSAGSFTNLAGATLEFSGGTHTLNQGASFTGAGTSLIDGGTVNVSAGATASVTGTFALATGTLGGTGTFLVTSGSQFNWTGGTMDGTSGVTVITNGATLTASGAADKDLRRRLDNHGTVAWTTGRILGHSTPVINNYAGALFDTGTDATLFESGDGTVKTLNNAGTVRKSGGTGTSFWNGVFNQSGTADVQTGTLNPVGAVMLNPSSHSGVGRFLITGATLAGTLTIASGANVELASGALAGTGTLAGTLNWTGGTIGSGGTLTIATNGALVVSTTADKDLRQALDNYGTVTWTAGRLLGHGSPVIHNRAGAVFEARADATLFDSGDGTVKTFNNSGKVRRTTGTGTTLWHGLLNNDGMLAAESGTLSLAGGGTSSGTFTNLAGATLTFSGGTQTLNDGASFTGAGTNQIAGGTVNVNAGATASAAGLFELSSGTLGGTGTFLVTSGSQFNWPGGTMAGTTGVTVITNGATLIASSGADKDLRRRLDNYGTVTWTAGRILGHATPTLNNYAGALFDAQVDATLFDSADGTVKTFNNAGTLRKSAGTGTTTVYGTFNLGGTANVQTGTLNPIGAVTATAAGYSGAGRFLFTTGTLNGTQTVAAGANVELASGTLLGTWTLAGTMNWTSGTLGAGGSTTIPAGSMLLVSSTADKDLRRTLDNSGTVLWTGGRLLGHSTPVINNNAGAVFETQVAATLFESGDGTTKTFNNNGMVRKSVATGTTTFHGTFNHNGGLEIQLGVLSLVNGYAPAAGSSLKVFLGGLTAGTQFGQLQVGGATAFTGTLNLVLTNSFVPVAGNSFLVVDSGSGSGTFSSLTGDALGGGLTLVPGYAGGDLTLTATMIASLPPLSPQAVGPERLLRWPGDAGGYVLETASSITGPWAPVMVPVAQENGDSVVRLPAGGTRFYRLVPGAPPRPGDNPTQ
ncbi:MAG: repeat-containing protein [Limisphaerales bacterium]|nr:MAG: repeat-containing protein [Limisphaerales bacterium]KAG0508179.1 MAG: PDK repeat-containing protein [Limisphaerales bacterium]TXT51409.1 MAG: repeat-containing protein [Limisphaerales bacterium]